MKLLGQNDHQKVDPAGLKENMELEPIQSQGFPSMRDVSSSDIDDVPRQQSSGFTGPDPRVISLLLR